MGTRKLVVTDDVYERLERLKLEGETLSDTIDRLMERGSIGELAGTWRDMPVEQLERFMEAIRELRSNADKDLLGMSRTTG